MSVTNAVSVAVGLSVLIAAVLKVDNLIRKWIGGIEDHLQRQDEQIAKLRRQLARVHAAVTDEDDDDDSGPDPA